MNRTSAKAFFLNALAGVESESIRKWAMSDHNLPIWVAITKGWLEKNGGPSEEQKHRLAAYILCHAIGA